MIEYVDKDDEYINWSKIQRWDLRLLRLADFIAHEWSKDPSLKVGAVIADSDHIVVGIGHNGFPRGVQDYEDRYENRKLKLAYVVHAEVNAILNATRSVKSCTLYHNQTFCCNECAKLIIQAGIKTVVMVDGVVPERWQESILAANTMFSEAGVEIRKVKL